MLGEGHFESGTHTPAAVLEWQVASAEVRLHGGATTHGEVTVGARARAGRTGSTDTYRLGVDRTRVANCVVFKGGLFGRSARGFPAHVVAETYSDDSKACADAKVSRDGKGSTKSNNGVTRALGRGRGGSASRRVQSASNSRCLQKGCQQRALLSCTPAWSRAVVPECEGSRRGRLATRPRSSRVQGTRRGRRALMI